MEEGKASKRVEEIELSQESRCRSCKEVVAREDEEILLFHRTTNEIKVINKTGKFIWDRCRGRHTLDQIVNELTRYYAVEREAAERDVRRFLKELLRLRFVRLAPSPAHSLS